MPEDIGGIVALGSGVVAIAGGIFATIKWGGTWVRAIKEHLSAYKPAAPRETLRIVVSGAYWETSGLELNYIHCWVTVHLTNISDREISIPYICIRKPRAAADFYRTERVAPNKSTLTKLDFFLKPPPIKASRSLKTDLIVVDNFANEHTAAVAFTPVALAHKKSVERALPEPEVLFSIPDRLEKNIVSILNAEITRFGNFVDGERGLGSVQLHYRHLLVDGVGTDLITKNTSRNPSIVFDCENARFISENLDGMLSLYEQTPSEQRARFREVLLARLFKGSAYAEIAYFVLLTMYSIRYLGDCLGVIPAKLNGETRGLEDAFSLLDALLKFRHVEFDEDMLDQCEMAAIKAPEHGGRIPERVAAIRAFRWARPDGRKEGDEAATSVEFIPF